MMPILRQDGHCNHLEKNFKSQPYRHFQDKTKRQVSISLILPNRFRTLTCRLVLLKRGGCFYQAGIKVSIGKNNQCLICRNLGNKCFKTFVPAQTRCKSRKKAGRFIISVSVLNTFNERPGRIFILSYTCARTGRPAPG
jgi:hypothetical protein